MVSEQHARSFGAAVDAYDRGRPGYPASVADALVPPGARLVVDVGAGTGKFTRTLTGRGAEVVAVEPDAAMRERLIATVPGVRALDGTGEEMPLPDASADVVTFAQSWHWVDPAPGAAEVARVLRPGGVLGLVWNVRDETLPWASRLGEVVKRPDSLVMDYGRPVVGEPFDEGTYERITWVHEQRREDLLAMVASRSYVITRPEVEQRAVLRDVEDLLDSDPDTAGRDVIAVPYVTHVHRYVRP